MFTNVRVLTFYRLPATLHTNRFYIYKFLWWLHPVYLFSEQTATFALYNINNLFFITEEESVYSAVRTESLYKIDTFRP